MKRKSSKPLLSILILSLLLSACGDSKASQDESTDSETSDEAISEKEEYSYPDIDLGGDTFTILNTAQTYGFYSTIDLEEQSGDSVDDAIFNRNRKIEEIFKTELEVNEEYVLNDAIAALKTSILADDSDYDAAFIYSTVSKSLFTDNYLTDMQYLENFHFDEEYWDTEATNQSRVGKNKKLLTAYGDISLTDFQGTIVNFFNENLMNDLQLELPYQLARDGKWTLDKMAEYMKAGTNLNGDESFTFSADGNATYGLTSWDQGEMGIIFGSDVQIIKLENDQPVITASDEKFVNAAQKVISLLSTDGEYIASQSGVTGGHYEQIFKSGRALLAISELKATNKYRDMEYSYGILPIPKADEAQESYCCVRNFSYFLCIPSTNDDPESAAAILDAMAYLTHKDVMPSFYEGRVSQKSLRNDDSIEMLELINKSRVTDIGRAFGWSDSYRSVVQNAIDKKSTDIVSGFATSKTSTQKKIDEMLELFEY